METQATARTIPWLPIFLILWNGLDIVVHVALDMAEPWRIAGNIVGIAAALIVVFGVAKPYAWQMLSGAAVVVVVLNAIHSILHGWLAPSFVFIGVAVFLLLFWAQNLYREANAGGETPVYLRWWTALGATVLGIAIVALVGPQGELELSPLTQLPNGEFVAADYWSDEPLILSAGMGFDNIVGLPEVTDSDPLQASAPASTERRGLGRWHASYAVAASGSSVRGAKRRSTASPSFFQPT